jgi:serine/threonine protein kinase
MIDQGGRAVLMDFGLMKDRDQDGLTTMGAVLGTPEYMAPEQAEGFEVTARSDIYSFGVLIYEMLAGRLPFLGTSVVGMLKAHMEEPPPNLAGIRPDIARELVKVVHKTLAKKPKDRYRSLAYMARDLLEVYDDPTLRDIAGDAPDARTVSLKRPPAARRLEKAVLILGIGVLVVALLVILSTVEKENSAQPDIGNGGPPEIVQPPPPGPDGDDDNGEPAVPHERPLVEVHLKSGRNFTGRMKEMRQTAHGPVWVLETEDGETVVSIEPGVEIIYPGR